MNINERNIAKFTAIREAKKAAILSNFADDGRKGRAWELDCARPASHKTAVSAQGRVDVSIKVMVNGKARYIPAECKTNGGRIDDLLNGSNKSAFVIYRLDTVQKHKASKSKPEWIEERKVPGVIIPTVLFLAMLQECNAIKEIAHHGVVDGLAIQPTSKKMYERLKKYYAAYPSMRFNNEYTYEDWDFEGLVL